ncbi:SagB/ThcOx family dehydrogenase [Patescibacteria group bacterium]
MKKIKLKYFGIALLIICLIGIRIVMPYIFDQDLVNKNKHTIMENQNLVQLPEVQLKSDTSLEEALTLRRSTREYSTETLSLEEIGQILWAAQGITDDQGHRTAPSAGALYPIEIYLVTTKVEGLSPGVYHYNLDDHKLKKTLDGEKREELFKVSLEQEAILNAPATIVMAAVYERTEKKYKERAERYVHMEAGHVAQNIALQAAVLELGTVTIGAFEDQEVQKTLQFPEDQIPVYVMPIGRIEIN